MKLRFLLCLGKLYLTNKNYNRAPEIAALVLASSIGILLDKWGRKNVALIGFVMLVIDH